MTTTSAGRTAAPPTGEEPGGGRGELEELRLRVAAQDRLIAAMIQENADIHALRRRNHDLEQYVGRVLDLAPVQAGLRVRRRLLRRPPPEG